MWLITFSGWLMNITRYCNSLTIQLTQLITILSIIISHRGWDLLCLILFCFHRCPLPPCPSPIFLNINEANHWAVSYNFFYISLCVIFLSHFWVCIMQFYLLIWIGWIHLLRQNRDSYTELNGVLQVLNWRSGLWKWCNWNWEGNSRAQGHKTRGNMCVNREEVVKWDVDCKRNALSLQENISSNAVRERGFNFDDARLMGGAWRNEPNPDSCKVYPFSWLEL